MLLLEIRFLMFKSLSVIQKIHWYKPKFPMKELEKDTKGIPFCVNFKMSLIFIQMKTEIETKSGCDYSEREKE